MSLFKNIKSYFPRNSIQTNEFVLKAYKRKGPNFISLKTDKSLIKKF